MAGSGAFRQETRATLRTRLLDAAREITTDSGWSALTMGAVATRAGISRQHVYNEIGTKHELGSAMVVRETDDFIAVMCRALRDHADDLVAGSAAAVAGALEHGSRNTLLKAILTADSGRGETLLPLLTASPEIVLARATRALYAEIAPGPALPDRGEPCDEAARVELQRYVDGLARLVVSHATQSTGPIDAAVVQAEWLARGFCRVA